MMVFDIRQAQTHQSRQYRHATGDQQHRPEHQKYRSWPVEGVIADNGRDRVDIGCQRHRQVDRDQPRRGEQDNRQATQHGCHTNTHPAVRRGGIRHIRMLAAATNNGPGLPMG